MHARTQMHLHMHARGTTHVRMSHVSYTSMRMGQTGLNILLLPVFNGALRLARTDTRAYIHTNLLDTTT